MMMDERELYVLGKLYQTSQSKLAKDNYQVVAEMIIREQPRERISELENLWQDIKTFKKSVCVD